MKKYVRARETAFQLGAMQNHEEEVETPKVGGTARISLGPHIPEFKERDYERYAVNMFGVTLVPVPKDTKVELYTEGLVTCTAVAMAVREPVSEETYGMLSHFPFYTGEEFDRELSRYERVTDDRAEKKVVIIIPYTENSVSSHEVHTVKIRLQEAGVRDENIVVLQHAPTGALVHCPQEGKVNLIFEKDGRVFVRHMGSAAKVITTELFQPE